MTRTKIWILVSSILCVVVAVVATVAWVVVRYVVPAARPYLTVATEIAKAYPGSNPNVGVMWGNGQKTMRVVVATSSNPSQNSTGAQAMADKIAQIVRDHCDLTGYSGITVVLEQRTQVGIVQTKTGRTFQFPVQSPKAGLPTPPSEGESP
jgi:hypothetical protein